MPPSDRLSRRLLIAIIAAAFAPRLFVALGPVPRAVLVAQAVLAIACDMIFPPPPALATPPEKS